ncbi:hypothetical protein BRD00_10705 [Halobacteriales archaeon QS_8_69_26]|nr:MAG: hypothetical protein BRD00_10705 [Halobacteriales archaeon QS_8_69_26]
MVLLAVSPAALLVPIGQSLSASDAVADAPAVGDCSTGCLVPARLSPSSIFPFAGDRETPKRSDPEVVEVDDERAGDLFDVLSAATARDVLREVSEEPRTAPELADAVDTSVQNVHYHLDNLHDAGAIAEVDTEYSSRGREMSVYTATVRPQVVVYDLE